MATAVPYGASTNLLEQSDVLFVQHMRRPGKLAAMRGKMPKPAKGIAQSDSYQTSRDMPIVQATDLGKSVGDEVQFFFMQPMGAYPSMGSERAVGTGTPMRLTSQKLRVDQARITVDTGDAMSQIRSPIDLVQFAHPEALKMMARYADNSAMVHMAGARGFHNTLEWGIPLASDPRFAKIMVNAVQAPTKNRHWVVNGDALIPVTSNAGELTTTSLSVLDIGIFDDIRNLVDNMALPPPPVIIEGDRAATDSPLRLMLLGPSSYNSFAKDPAYRSYLAAANTRASKAADHPLFLGDVALWNGFVVMKQALPIRFYAGDVIKYCASYTSETESEVTVPASFGTSFAVERNLILGGQALAEAMARHPDYNGPIFWGEEKSDFGDKRELMIGRVGAAKKVRWLVNNGTEEQYTDHGIIAIDAVVPLTGERN